MMAQHHPAVTPGNEIRAIETHYAGHRFRSRLEARWAVFFDTLGIQWEYEPQGYVVDGVPYLPDFRLRGLGGDREIWFEVKGQFPTHEEVSKAQGLAAGTDTLTFIHFGGVTFPDYRMPANDEEFHDYESGWWYDPVFGWRNDWQGPPRWDIGVKPCAVRIEPKSKAPSGLGCGEVGDTRRAPGAYSGPWWWAECPTCGRYAITKHGWTGACCTANNEAWLASDNLTSAYNHATDAIRGAYRAARSARFEHGEQG